MLCGWYIAMTQLGLQIFKVFLLNNNSWTFSKLVAVVGRHATYFQKQYSIVIDLFNWFSFWFYLVTKLHFETWSKHMTNFLFCLDTCQAIDITGAWSTNKLDYLLIFESYIKDLNILPSFCKTCFYYYMLYQKNKLFSSNLLGNFCIQMLSMINKCTLDLNKYLNWLDDKFLGPENQLIFQIFFLNDTSVYISLYVSLPCSSQIQAGQKGKSLLLSN